MAQQRASVVPRVSPNAYLNQTIGITQVVVTYGRPAARDRVLFGGEGALAPNGQIWRAGSDEATTISFSSDVQLEGVHVHAGTYSLFTTPGPDRWKIHLNEVVNQWGAYQYDASKDVVVVEVTPTTGSHVERLTYTFPEVSADAGVLELAWGTMRVPVRISVDTPALVRVQAEAAMAGSDARMLIPYVRYGMANGMDVRSWAGRVVELDRSFATLALQADAHAAASDFAGAITAAEAALVMGRAMENPPRAVEALAERLAGWRAR